MDTPETYPPSPPEFARIVVSGGNLYTETGRPLYRYFPLGELSRRGLNVPCARTWHDYIQAWAYTYPPMPRTASDTPAIQRGGLSFQERIGAAAGRDYPQAVYRGWPLYLCDLDAAGFGLPPQGTVAGLFELVSVDEPRVVWHRAQQHPPQDEPTNVEWPPVFSGP